MPGTISFGGIGSGIDTEGIVNGLVGASSGAVSSLKSRAASTHAAVSTLSDLGSMLATLKTSLEALDEPSDAASYTASSSSTAIGVSALGTAQPGSYAIDVTSLAKEQRTYTDAFASSTTALGQSGNLDITVGTDGPVSITIDAADTLEDIVGKINSSSARVNASVFYDGTNYYMQVSGQDTGTANAISFAETTTTLGLTTPANTKQAASDAVVSIDGFTVTRSTNQISGAIQGLTLDLTETTTSPVTVSVAADPDGLQTKLESLVTAYNAVVDKIQATAGYGSIKPTNPVLAGDSMLRGLGTKLSAALQTVVAGSGNYQTLGSIGLTADKSGKLSLDSAKFSTAVQTDPDSVKQMLAGVTGNDGAMDVFRDVVGNFTETGTGLLDMRKETLEERADSLDDRVAAEEKRLERYADLLRKQFSSMDTRVAASNAQMDYLIQLYSGG